MKNCNEFESREEYLSYMKMLFLKDGMKCMLLSAGVLLLLFVIGAEAVQEKRVGNQKGVISQKIIR